jgi:hypothetical protein
VIAGIEIGKGRRSQREGQRERKYWWMVLLLVQC